MIRNLTHYDYDTLTLTHVPFIPPRDRLVEDARVLSSGTIATLTGLTRYDDIEPVQAAFVEFCQARAGRYESWVYAWRAFAEARGIGCVGRTSRSDTEA